MPYIKEERREIYDKPLLRLIGVLLNNRRHSNFNGDMTYCIFKMIYALYECQDPCWEDHSNAKKILREVYDEYQRRFAGPYEQKKLEEDGDV